jgi:hypothetical protein
LRSYNLPSVRGVLTPDECRQTALSIAAAQEPSGAIPWFEGGHTDPWDHVECAMALTTAGLLQTRSGIVEDANSDTNFCAYIATGVWHHVLITGDRRFANTMWPVVRDAINFVLDHQAGDGEIYWASSPSGPDPLALMTGCASIFHSIRCALALANHVEDPQPDWEISLGRLGHAISHHPEAFEEKDRWSMEWYYPILGSALRGPAAHARIKAWWDDFVVPGLGIRCVSDRPWVTGAETCEFVMALDALGYRAAAREQFAAMQHLREEDGSYWTGLVFADGKRWPEERTTWTGAAMILAADTLSATTPAAGLFRAHDLPHGIEVEFDCACVSTGTDG